jgi:hypothetical protein
MPIVQTRRRFLTTLSLAGAASLVRPPRALAAESPLETTTVRIANEGGGIRTAPLFVADHALEGLRSIPYERWREDDPEDSIRFYALRLHEAGLIKSSPNKLIADGTDWRFLNELKRELKG